MTIATYNKILGLAWERAVDISIYLLVLVLYREPYRDICYDVLSYLFIVSTYCRVYFVMPNYLLFIWCLVYKNIVGVSGKLSVLSS